MPAPRKDKLGDRPKPKPTQVDDIHGKREAIMTAALSLFAERGFHGTAVPLVAEKAGVGAGTVYRYFASKEDLVNALYQHWKLKLSTAMFEHLKSSASSKQLFLAVWMRMAEFALRHPGVIQFLELHHHGSYLDQKSLTVERGTLRAIEEVLVGAQKRGEVKGMPAAQIIALVNGAFVGMMKGAKSQNGFPLDSATLEAAGRCMWDAIKK